MGNKCPGQKVQEINVLDKVWGKKIRVINAQGRVGQRIRVINAQGKILVRFG